MWYSKLVHINTMPRIHSGLEQLHWRQTMCRSGKHSNKNLIYRFCAQKSHKIRYSFFLCVAFVWHGLFVSSHCSHQIVRWKDRKLNLCIWLGQYFSPPGQHFKHTAKFTIIYICSHTHTHFAHTNTFSCRVSRFHSWDTFFHVHSAHFQNGI